MFWQSGVLDEAKMTFQAARTGLLDLDVVYAPKTQLDGHGRRILWDWIPERCTEDAMRKAGWSGMMSLPRVMSLDKDGVLRLQIVQQTASLRSTSIPRSVRSGMVSVVLPKANGEVFCLGLQAKRLISICRVLGQLAAYCLFTGKERHGSGKKCGSSPARRCAESAWLCRGLRV